MSILLTLVAGFLAACEQQKPVAAPPPPPKVQVAAALVRDVTKWDEYTGTLAAVETVDVKAQVSGFVESVPFTEGALVQKGDLLLTIDSRIFRAQVDNAKADILQSKAKLALAEATLQLSRNDLTRIEDAAAKGAASPEEVDTRRAQVAQNEAVIQQSQAAIAASEAAEKVAQLNVDWCTVRAPITGRISKKGITPGNMLTGGSGTTTTITTIRAVDPIYCYVDVDESAVLRYQKLAREKKRTSAEQEMLPCYIGLENETDFPHEGVIDFVDNTINTTTGTRQARGIFPNKDGHLIPGFFARFRVVGQEYKGALLVIDDAVGTDQDKKYVYMLHKDADPKLDNTIERRAVTVGPLEGELRVVQTGLQPDDLVLINGMAGIGIRPGAKVDPATIPMTEHRLPLAPLGGAGSQPASAPATQAATQTTTQPGMPAATRPEAAQ